MLKSSILYIPLAIAAYLAVGLIIAAAVADIYLFNVEVVKAKKPVRMTGLCVTVILAVILRIRITIA